MKISIVLYSAKWCKPCEIFKKEYWNSLQEEFEDAEFEIVDIENTEKDVSEISSIPFLVVKNGNRTIKAFKNILNQIDDLVDLLEELLPD